MFRRFPLLQRLITWSKPHALVDPAGEPAYERYDWNSLLVESARRAASGSPGSWRAPPTSQGAPRWRPRWPRSSRPTACEARYGCTWESTERTGRRVRPAHHRRRLRRPAWRSSASARRTRGSPAIPGLEQVPHYADVGDVSRFAGRRVFVIGKRNGAFELADGLLAHASQIVMASPRPANLSILTRSTAGARARYLQVYEDAVLGGGTYVLDAALTRVERMGEGWRVSLDGTSRPGQLTFAVDDVIAATGWNVPMLDLPDLGVRTFHQGRLPGADSVLGERDRPRHLLRRHDHDGRGGPEEARHPQYLRGRPRLPVQRPGPGGQAGRATLRRGRPPRPAVDPERLPATVARAAHRRRRAVEPAGLPGRACGR